MKQVMRNESVQCVRTHMTKVSTNNDWRVVLDPPGRGETSNVHRCTHAIVTRGRRKQRGHTRSNTSRTEYLLQAKSLYQVTNLASTLEHAYSLETGSQEAGETVMPARKLVESVSRSISDTGKYPHPTADLYQVTPLASIPVHAYFLDTGSKEAAS